MTTLYDFQQNAESILMDFYNARASGAALDITEDELRNKIKELRLEFILSREKKVVSKSQVRSEKVTSDVISALMNFGFSKRDATNAELSVSKEITKFDEVFKFANNYLRKV